MSSPVASQIMIQESWTGIDSVESYQPLVRGSRYRHTNASP